MHSVSATTTPARRRHRLPLAAAAIGGALSLLLGVGAANATPASDAAGWVTSTPQWTSPASGKAYLGGSGTPDVGLSADGVFALAASGDTTHEGDLLGWLDDSSNATVVGYVTDGSHYYPGALAKLALSAYTGLNNGISHSPTSFAGVNLLTRLEATQDPSGEYVDYRGYDNPTTQALAIIALTKAARTTTLADAADFLEGDQCGDGTWAAGWGYCDPSSSPQGDPDTTAVAAIALDYYDRTYTDPAAATAASDGYTALDSIKHVVSGSQTAWRNYCQSPWTSLDDSVNSTGLAVAALHYGGGYGTDVTNGNAWLQAAQQTDHGLPACTSAGASDVRATVQGILGLAEKSYVDLI